MQIKLSTVSHFLLKDIPAMLRYLGRERCPPTLSWYKRTDLVHHQKKSFEMQLLDVQVYSSAHDLICHDENICRRDTPGSICFFVNSSKYLYQDSELNKVTPKRVKLYEKAQNIKESATYPDVLRAVLSLHKVCRYEKPHITGSNVYICDCKAFQVTRQKIFII